MKLIFFYLFILINCYSTSLKELWIEHPNQAQGAFIVCKLDQSISLLRIHTLSSSLILEEISGPYNLIHSEFSSYKKWVESKAPHHTSWVLYKIDLVTNKIVSCYSLSQNSFISLGTDSTLITTLLNVPLEEVRTDDRKKIGPKPLTGEMDTRKLWNPQVVIDGKKIPLSVCLAKQAIWPKDSSELSGRLIDLYFDKNQPLFPFPYWIEIGDGYNCHKIPIIDSGFIKTSLIESFPKIAPTITSISFDEAGLMIQIDDSYLEGYQVIFIEIGKKSTQTIYLTLKNSRIESNRIKISKNELEKHLTKDKRYRVALINTHDLSDYTESSDSFIYR